MSRYLKLARRAAAREERHETAEKQVLSRGSVYPPISQSPTLAHKLDESCEEPDSPLAPRDESDISDQSPDYQAVAEVLRDPPYWLRDSYMAGYRRGALSLHALSAAVAAALECSPYVCTERLKPVVDEVFKQQQEATDVDVYSAKSGEHAKEGGRGL